MGKMFLLISKFRSNVVFLALMTLHFYSAISITITYSFNCIRQAKYEEKPIDNASFFIFSQYWI